MPDWPGGMLSVLSEGCNAISRSDLESRLGLLMETPVDPAAFGLALEALQREQLIRIEGAQVRRTEPDFKERLLESAVFAFLQSTEAQSYLKLKSDDTVYATTATGGAYGRGRWSIPDFTVATIRSWQFDPLRHLDVISVELKNRSGSGIVAAHEALAHTRFAHFSYLACPRSHLRKDDTRRLREECTNLGVGLILFDLSVAKDEGPKLSAFEFDLSARRHDPDPESVEAHLENRLPGEAKSRLLEIARGT